MPYPWNPNDTLTAGDLNAAIGNASGTGAGTANVGRNYLHNSMFNVQQRGPGLFTITSAASQYTADRWFGAVALPGDSLAITLVAQNDGNRAAIGDESARYLLSAGFTGGGAGGVCDLVQRIEDVRRLAGKTVTLSFWASASATLKFGANMGQVFGTGGSPSVSVLSTDQAVTLSTTWARYSMTFTLPSVAGKTFGTTPNTDYTALALIYSGQAYLVGNQTGTINLWGVQLEVGNVVTPLEKLDPVIQIQQCQRFLQIGAYNYQGYGGAAATNVQTFALPVPMRGSINFTNTPSGGNVTLGSSGISGAGGTNTHVAITAISTALGTFFYTGSYSASADL